MIPNALLDKLKNAWQRHIARLAPHLAEPADTDTHEKALIENIEDLVELTAEDVMVPRADIVAIEVGAQTDEFLNLIKATPHSRIPVYQNTLDDILGFVHIKDVLQTLAQGAAIHLRDMLREVMIVSPSLPALDLLVEMRKSNRNLALVIDEYGGIDGLVTMVDLISAIVGEMNDEHRVMKSPRLMERGDGTILVDARYPLDGFEKLYGPIFSDEEHAEADTLGGLAMFLSGRLPKRGELLTHSSGMQIEIVDADARRLRRLRLRNAPRQDEEGAAKTAAA